MNAHGFATWLIATWLISLTIFVAIQTLGDFGRWQQVGARLHALEAKP